MRKPYTKTFFFLAGLLLMGSGCVDKTVSTQGQFEQQYQAALKALQENEIKKSLVLCSHLVSVEAEDAGIAHAMALAGYVNQFIEGNTDKAIFYYEKFTKKYFKNPLIVNVKKNLADCYFMKGDYQKAKTEYAQIRNTFGEFENIDEIDYRIAICVFNMNDYEGALRELQKIIKRHPKSRLIPSALYTVAMSFEKKNEPEKAKDIYRRLTEGYPNSFLAAKK